MPRKNERGVRKLRDKKTDTRPCIVTVKEKVWAQLFDGQ